MKNGVLVAVSGGVDSIVLLDRIVKSDAVVGVAHVHHGIRPESDEEYEFVKRLAASYGVPFYGECLSFPNGGSQAAYREARYTFFEKIMHEKGYTTLMTAHHADDELETVLIQLHRNVVEVTGIPETRAFGEGMIVRPLLTETKESIIHYAKIHRLVWREDQSNLQTEYLRNQIRHHIVPELRLVWPTVVQDVSKAAKRQREIWQKRYRFMKGWMNQFVQFEMKAFHVKLSDIKSLQEVERYVLGRLLSIRYKIEVGEGMRQLVNSSNGTGQIDLEGNYQLKKQNGIIRLAIGERLDEMPHDFVISTLPSQIKFGSKQITFEVVEGVDGIPLDSIELPFVIRSPQPGDAIKLSIGTKKIARVLIDKKIPRENRPYVPLLVDARGEIIAIVGIRYSDFPDKSDAICPRLMVK